MSTLSSTLLGKDWSDPEAMVPQRRIFKFCLPDANAETVHHLFMVDIVVRIHGATHI